MKTVAKKAITMLAIASSLIGGMASADAQSVEVVVRVAQQPCYYCGYARAYYPPRVTHESIDIQRETQHIERDYGE